MATRYIYLGQALLHVCILYLFNIYFFLPIPLVSRYYFRHSTGEELRFQENLAQGHTSGNCLKKDLNLALTLKPCSAPLCCPPYENIRVQSGNFWINFEKRLLTKAARWPVGRREDWLRKAKA